MLVREQDNVTFMQFLHLSGFDDIKHAVFTRNSGKSRKPYNSLNVGFGVGDEDQNVVENREILSRCIGATDLIFMDQVHGTRVLVIAEDDAPFLPDDTKNSTESDSIAVLNNASGGFDPDAEQGLVGDALITNTPENFLVVQVADCQSILLYDPMVKVVSNIHSGWRGSINNIIGSTVQAMTTYFGCASSDIVAGIGPSLGPCCAEFINYKKEIPEKFWQYKGADNHFDFWSASLDQLCQAGVLSENIDLSRICTKCNTDLFFSFRGEGATGRFATLIGLV